MKIHVKAIVKKAETEEVSKCQYFSFYPDCFDASEVNKNVNDSYAEDWDYCLIEYEEGRLESAVANDRGTRFRSLDGTNTHGFEFMKAGSYSYEEKDYAKFKRFAK